MEVINIAVYYKDRIAPCNQYVRIEDKLDEFYKHLNLNILLPKECVFINIEGSLRFIKMNTKYG